MPVPGQQITADASQLDRPVRRIRRFVSVGGIRPSIPQQRPRSDETRRQQTSALSQLNFGIDGFAFTAGIVDSHLPVDAALSGVDIV